MTIKRIVCLAVSRKNLNYCVAGKEITPSGVGDWIRPTGSGEDGAVSLRELELRKGKKPDLLDIVEIGLHAHCPEYHQTENWGLDATSVWRKAGAFPKNNLHALLDSPGILWEAGAYGPGDSRNDRVLADVAHKLPNSLYFIQPAKVTFHLSTSFSGSEQIRGSFIYGAYNYSLVLTDPVAVAALRNTHKIKMGIPVPIERVYLCISLSLRALNGNCFKLIAGVIFP